MRNLSKVLALVLSLALVLTMFAGAIQTVSDTLAFSDEDAMSDAGNEAVMVLGALGIVNGYPDGSFQPEADVTRAEYAKMLSVALAASDVATSYKVTSLPFSDYFDDWCIPYINYCYLSDIMVGYGDGYMLPKNNVTGFEAVKMTLVGLGYDPKIEGLEGSAWQNNTSRLANKVGLLKNLQNENLYNAFGREATAILIYNAIYTNTITYVGNNANQTDVTLGEKVYDLVDIRGIVVANEYGALGANWTNAMHIDGAAGREVVFMDYQNMATKGQTIFAYRDYTGASTAGGYYVPRLVRTAIASDYADLGRAFRVLTTGAQTVYNTSEVRKVYGVLWEVNNDDVATYDSYEGILSDGKITGTTSSNAEFKNNMLNKMYLSAVKANSAVTKDFVQYNIFIDGVAKSYAAAETHINAYTKSSAPFRYVDNDKDGVVDSLFLYTYTAAKVLAVDGQDLTLAGIGKVTIHNDVTGIAKDDYVAYYKDNQYKYVNKLESKVAKVSGYSNNSGNAFFDKDDIKAILEYLGLKNVNTNDFAYTIFGTTTGGGTYTVDGTGYTFGTLAAQFGYESSSYFEALIGVGSSAVTMASTFKFVFDGKYIVAAFETDETYWENYAIVMGYNDNDVTLGKQHVRLYTDDNEYKDFYVVSINGTQVYNTLVRGDWYNLYPYENTLVRYEVSSSNPNDIAIYTADYANASSNYSSDFDFYFNQTTKQWVGYDYKTSGVQNGTTFTWANGVVFVSYGYPQLGVAYDVDLGWNIDRGLYVAVGLQWRAYRYDEFQPASSSEASASMLAFADYLPNNARYWFDKGDRIVDEVVYAKSINGTNTLKAAAITFNYSGFSIFGTYLLPGLPLRDGQAIWGTVMSATSYGTVTDEGTTKYMYKFNILNPWSGGTKEITYYADFAQNTPVKGNIYKLFMSDDGICRRYELAANGVSFPYVVGFNYLEYSGYTVTGISEVGDNYIIEVKYPGSVLGVFTTLRAELVVPKTANIYFTKNLFTDSVEAIDYVSYFGGLGVFNKANEKSITIYADANLMTGTASSVWINEQAAPTTVTLDLKITLAGYNTNTKEATYLVYGLGVTGGEIYQALPLITSFKVTQEPDALLLEVGSTDTFAVKCTATNAGGWIVNDFLADVTPNLKKTTYNSINAPYIKIGTVNRGSSDFKGFFSIEQQETTMDSSLLGRTYKGDNVVFFDGDTQFFWRASTTTGSAGLAVYPMMGSLVSNSKSYFYSSVENGLVYFDSTQCDIGTTGGIKYLGTGARDYGSFTVLYKTVSDFVPFINFDSNVNEYKWASIVIFNAAKDSAGLNPWVFPYSETFPTSTPVT